jgi:hypothetical protein
LEENIASIFRVEEYAKQETSMKLCDVFLRNVGWLSVDYAAVHPRR